MTIHRPTFARIRSFNLLFSLAWLAGMLACRPPAEGANAWHQWGGPTRDFKAVPVSLAPAWPEDGPMTLWRRPLGEGYAGVTVIAGRVLTQYREGDEEHLVALDDATGRELWRVSHHEPAAWYQDRFGHGPLATPAVREDRVFAVTSGGIVFAVDVASGRTVWQQDTWPNGPSDRPPNGVAASPLLFENIVLLPIKEGETAMIALDADDGTIAWTGGDFAATFASPILATWDGDAHLVVFGKDTVAGLDPRSGATRWQVPHPNPNGANVTTPIASAEGALFLSSGPEKGARMLTRDTGGEGFRESWATPRFRVFYTNALWIDDTIYGANGGVGPAMLAAVDAASGDVLWRDRRVGRANLVHAGQLSVALDDEGRLFLLRLTRAGLEVLAEAPVFESRTWTAPTLVGDRLYLRDRHEIVALSLPVQPPK